jgi:hypothetical protein
MGIITKENVKKLVLEFKEKYNGLDKIINPIIEKYNLPQKELIEVCQVGKYVHLINEQIQIIDKPKPPAPDFILKDGTNIVGLEHTRIFTENVKAYQSIVSLFNYAEKIFREKFPSEFALANINLKNDKLEYKQKEKKLLATQIADLVYNVKMGEIVNFPEYIDDIRISKHSQVSINYLENNFQGPYLTKENLIKEIKKKEKKIELYKSSEIVMSEYWLILLIGSLSSVSYQLDENVDYRTNSLFDRVYLMSDFSAEIIRVK